MQSNAATVKGYLASLSADRREAIEAVRKVILKNLDKDYEEGMQYGGIAYYIPHSMYPQGYHCDPTKPLCYAGLASQKNYMSVYIMSVYGSPAQLAEFQRKWKATGKKLDMGKTCIRFKSVEDLALDVIGDTIKSITAKKWIEVTERALEQYAKSRKPAARKSEPRKPASKKRAAARA